MRCKLRLLVIALLATSPLLGQPVDNTPYYKGFQSGYAIYNWTTSNGLPQSHISGITQTANRLIWLGTYDGVIHFDGRKFVKTASKFILITIF